MLDIFITGTDTDIGKTFITAGLAATMQSLGYSTCVYKPVQSGAIVKSGFMQAPDLTFVKSIDPYIKTHASYMLKEPTAPLVAAELENIEIDKLTIKKDYDALSKEHDCTIVEGAGGLMVPIAPNFMVVDMIKMLNLPVVIVARPDLGTVNHTILTINQAAENGIKVRGVIINNFPEYTNDISIKSGPRLIEEYSDAKILGIVKHFDNINKLNPSDLITHILNGIDIESVFDVKIAKLELE